jgi:hypothetical protein
MDLRNFVSKWNFAPTSSKNISLPNPIRTIIDVTKRNETKPKPKLNARKGFSSINFEDIFT